MHRGRQRPVGTDGDWLEGGEGADTLLGGQGIDTYRFEVGFGNDTVIDAHGQGVLSFAGTAIPIAAGGGFIKYLEKAAMTCVRSASGHGADDFGSEIAVEDQSQADEPSPYFRTWNHSQMMLADSLAVHVLLARVNPNFRSTNSFVLQSAA